MAEKEKKARLNQEWTISTDKLEDLETGEDKERQVAKKPEPKTEKKEKKEKK